MFLGWYTDDGNLYNFAAPVTADVHLTARFEQRPAISEVTVNCIGDIDYTVSGQTVTVNHSVPCMVLYPSGSKYVAITPTKNANGTYSFTAPAGVTEVVLAVKGDVTGDGMVNMGDISRVYANIRGTSLITEGYLLTVADVTGDGMVNMGDISKIYAHIRGTSLLTW